MIASFLLMMLQNPPAADAFPGGLSLPVKCRIGDDCLVQKLVDHEPGPGRRDYRCGVLTTEQHDGVDFRLRTLRDLKRGIVVTAAADGTVLRIRDGEPEAVKTRNYVPSGREAGNSVVIGHGSGWETQYSHLQNGSISVRPGQRVRAGDALGRIGLSGMTEFPHLHFAVRQSGKTIDPFIGAAPPAPCSKSDDRSGLWSPEAARALIYRPTAIISVGFAPGQPDAAQARAGQPAHSTLAANVTALILWADAIGASPGDLQRFVILGPGGRTIHRHEAPIEKGGLSWFGYSGRKAPASGWPAGAYVGRYELVRAGKVVASRDAQLRIGR